MTELILPIGILQLLIPLALLFWQWHEASLSRFQWLFKTILAVSYLAAIIVAGLWNWIPFFVPYLFLGASLMLAARGLLQIRGLPLGQARTVRERLTFGVTALLAVVTVAFALYALSGWRIPPGKVVQLSFPLRDGTFYIASGGSNSLLNPHLKTLEGERFRAFRGQSYAVDILQINHWGFRAAGILPADPAQYRIFGAPIYAPCGGTVIETENNLADLSPPQSDREHLSGNHVILDCGEFLVLLAHFRQGSVQVSPGQTVGKAQVIGQVGNSGNTGEPHLHIHAQLRGAQGTPLSGEPLWALFEEGFLVRNQIVRR